MKLAKMKVCKRQHGAEIELFCPECDGEAPPHLDLERAKPVTRNYQKSVILKAKCSGCGKTFSAVVRLN